MPPTIQIACLHPPLSADTVPFYLITAGSTHWTDRWTGRHTHIYSPSPSIFFFSAVSGQVVWVGTCPRERLRRWKEPISALTFVSVPLSWHTAGGHGGSLAASHIDYQKRHRGGGDQLLTLMDRQTDGQMDRWQFEAAGQVVNKLDWGAESDIHKHLMSA